MYDIIKIIGLEEFNKTFLFTLFNRPILNNLDMNRSFIKNYLV